MLEIDQNYTRSPALGVIQRIPFQPPIFPNQLTNCGVLWFGRPMESLVPSFEDSASLLRCVYTSGRTRIARFPTFSFKSCAFLRYMSSCVKSGCQVVSSVQ